MARLLLFCFLSLVVTIVLQALHPLRLQFLGDTYVDHILGYDRNIALFFNFAVSSVIINIWALFVPKTKNIDFSEKK